jgi:hypothetical protein
MEDFLDGDRQVSVLSHEMFHTLGAPDLYRYNNNTIDPVGGWDLMCGDRHPSQTTNIWMKHKYGGWVEDIPELTVSDIGEHTLNNVWSDTCNAFKILSPNSYNEFFIIEYRDKSVFWDSNTPGTGLLIYRVNPSYNGNADGPPDEIYVFRQGGTNTTTNGNLNNAHFSTQTGRVEFNDTSNPPCFLMDNEPGGISIYIKDVKGETISFDISNATLNADPMVLDFGSVLPGTTSDPVRVDASGDNLYENISYAKEGQYGKYFTITPISWDPVTGGTLEVTFSPSSVGTFNATLTIKSKGAPSKKVALTGKASLSIDDQTNNPVKIYPNPTTGVLTIETENESIAQVFSVEGRLLLEQNITTTGTIDLSAFANGLYCVKIEDKQRNTVLTKTIVFEK